MGFPEHRYTAELKLLHGHLHMKLNSHENALQDYEGVVREYTPVEQRIAEIEQDAMRPIEWFDTLVDADSLSTIYNEDLPRYAVEMLASDPEVARALDLHKELEKQRTDLKESETLIAEIQAAFDSGADGISSFQQARLEIGRLELEMNQLRSELLITEEAWLLANLPSNLQPEVRALQVARDNLVTNQGAQARQQAEQKAENARVRADRIKGQMLALQTEITDQERQAQEIGERLTGSDLNDAEKLDLSDRLRLVRDDLSSAQANRADMEQEYQRLSKESVDASQMGTQLANTILAEGYVALHKKLAPYRRHVTDSDKASVTGRLDSSWAQVAVLQKETERLRERIESLETSELTRLQAAFDEEVVNVARERVELTGSEAEASALANHAARSGFFRLRNTFAESVLKADKGIVDVHWVRKTNVSDEVSATKKEREALVRELNQRFSSIRQGLPEPVEPPAEIEEGSQP